MIVLVAPRVGLCQTRDAIGMLDMGDMIEMSMIMLGMAKVESERFSFFSHNTRTRGVTMCVYGRGGISFLILKMVIFTGGL